MRGSGRSPTTATAVSSQLVSMPRTIIKRRWHGRKRDATRSGSSPKTTGLLYRSGSGFYIERIPMALSLKDPETDRLAREVARLTGESLTTAVRTALAERLEREKLRRG